MKKNALFEACLQNVNSEIKEEVNLNIDIANRIYDLLKAKKMTQRELAERMGKKESEISRWLTGSYGFTTKTLAKISSVLGEPIIEVKSKQESQMVVSINQIFNINNKAKNCNYIVGNMNVWSVNYAACN